MLGIERIFVHGEGGRSVGIGNCCSTPEGELCRGNSEVRGAGLGDSTGQVPSSTGRRGLIREMLFE